MDDSPDLKVVSTVKMFNFQNLCVQKSENSTN